MKTARLIFRTCVAIKTLGFAVFGAPVYARYVAMTPRFTARQLALINLSFRLYETLLSLGPFYWNMIYGDGTLEGNIIAVIIFNNSIPKLKRMPGLLDEIASQRIIWRVYVSNGITEK